MHSVQCTFYLTSVLFISNKNIKINPLSWVVFLFLFVKDSSFMY